MWLRFLTLSVLLCVVALWILFPRLVSHRHSNGHTASKAALYVVSTALAAFGNDAGRYPTTAEGLDALTTAPASLPMGKWDGPYLDKAPRDAWGEPLIYRSPGEDTHPFDLTIKGPDKKLGTADDVTNTP